MPTFFRDINLFTLKGKDEILYNDLKYPYIQIDSINEQKKKITYFYNKDLRREDLYTQNELGWVKLISFNDGLVDNLRYEIVSGNGIVLSLGYVKNPASGADPALGIEGTDPVLQSCSILRGSTLNHYVFSMNANIHLPITNKVEQIPLKRATRVRTEKFNVSKGVLTIEAEQLSRKKDQLELESIQKQCFYVGNLPFSWCYTHYPNLENVDCE
ncbi:hypothetical protein [Ohtaekwangia koreensis]|nr:hypothetical protein [Ohtaekwangia koreensis]